MKSNLLQGSDIMPSLATYKEYAVEEYLGGVTASHRDDESEKCSTSASFDLVKAAQL